jgi:hypothetical protein
MRNTTKLKAILSKYTVTLDLSAEGEFTLILMDKETLEEGTDIYGKSYSEVLRKAYSYYKRKLKEA